MFTVGNGPLSWECSSQGLELITDPNLVLIFLCATIGMLLSDLYLLHMCV